MWGSGRVCRGLSGPNRSYFVVLGIVAALGLTQVPSAGAGAGRNGAGQPAPCPAVPGQPSGGSPRLMIVGDSISQGSSGDYTWQFRLYEHLRADGVLPQMVGPVEWLDNNVTGIQGDCSYADPRFERANDAVWGWTLFQEEPVIRTKVATYRPNYLLVLLGINDLLWFGISQPNMAANLDGFIAQARAAQPHIKIVLGFLLPDIFTQTRTTFAASVAAYNNTISAAASRLTTASSPIVVAHDRIGFNVAADTWDGMHPNANGEVRIAAGFADALAGQFHLGRLYPTPFPALPTGPLTQPQLKAVPSATAGSVVLSWTLAPGASSYGVYVEDLTQHQTTFTQLSPPLTPSQNSGATVGTLTSHDTYDVKLQACKGNDCGALSNVASVTVP
jgi:GDSL-like Lipase/Acylhydrolase family